MERSKKTNIVAVSLLFAALLAAMITQAARTRDPFYSETEVAMGTEVKIRVYGTGKKNAAADILERVEKEENEYWSWRVEGSAVNKLNAAQSSMQVERTVMETINEIMLICADTDGELDLTVGALTRLWDFDSGPPYVVPESEELEKALESVGYQNVSIDGLNMFLKNNAQIDLGAFGKGLACDAAKAVLEKSRVKGGTVSVGGSVLVYGSPYKKDAWSVGIRNPDGGPDEYFAVLELQDCTVSTSGAYEKGFTSNGVYYHHILSAKTGMPVDSSLKSVTVVSKRGMISDALSTSCYILGYEDGLPLLKKYESEAVFVDNENNVYVTEGLKNKITIANDEFTLVRD